ncbi:MAG: HAD family hydrolase [Alphaproteobacteria bacterium]|nr:HAD family hydrolase [Alphaproteobacteria bacterium]
MGVLPAPPQLVIFDCDGVLVDSEPIANRILAAAINRLGYSISVAQTRTAMVGHSMVQVMEKISQMTGKPLQDDWRVDLQRETYAAFRRSLRAVPGVEQAITRIRDAGIKICVASSGSPGKMELTLGLTGLRSYFGGSLYSSTMVARGKPHPDLFLLAASRMGVLPGRAVVIEDSAPGAAGACAAGMRVLAYAGDEESETDRLRAEGAEIFADMAQLPGLLGI